MDKSNKHTNIERYLRKEMDSSEQAAFRGEMDRNKDLRGEVTFYEDVATIVRKRKLLADVRAELQGEDFFAAENSNKGAKVVAMPNRGFGRVRTILAYAASVLVLVLAGTSWWANQNYSNDSLAQFAYTDIDGSSIARDGDSVDPFQQGLDAIEAKDYEGATNFFQSVPNNSESYTAAQLYVSYAQYEAADYVAAITSAKAVLATNPVAATRFSAEWLIVQAKLSNNEQDSDFQNRLNTIATNPNHDFQEDAQELQIKLGSFWRTLVF